MRLLAYSGFFRPKNPHKYEGDPSNIVYRSLWELKAMRKFDTDENVLSYSSEEFFIPYFSRLDNKHHRYFPDFKVTIKDSITGEIVTYVFEVKPDAQTKPPIDPGRRSTRYINECKTYIINTTKWEYANIYAQERGWKFMLLTEYTLGIAKRKKSNG